MVELDVIVQKNLIEEAYKLRTHPEFHAARNALAKRHAALFRTNYLLMHRTAGEGRYLIGLYLLYRHFAYDPVNPDSAITVSDVQAFCAEHELAGHNKVASLINLHRQSGYLRLVRNIGDRRFKRLEMTPRAIASAKKMFMPFLEALSTLSENGNYIPEMEADDEMLKSIVAFLHYAFLNCGSVLDLTPEMQLFLNHSAGYEIVLKLISTEQPGEEMPERTVYFHYGDISESLGVSRAHVRRLIEEAEETGYVTVHAAGGRAVEVHAHLVDLVDTYISRHLAGILLGIQSAGTA